MNGAYIPYDSSVDELLELVAARADAPAGTEELPGDGQPTLRTEGRSHAA